VGILAQIVGLGILTLLMHPDSIFSLSPTIFDNSTGFRTRFYWAQLITIAIVTPVSFLLNKFWTFSAVRGKHRLSETSEETVESEHPTAGV
jgi:putative flippase GtrA